MKQINEDPTCPQLCVFPEGCTTCGRYLLRFKRGAFEALSPIQPIYIEYSGPFCIASYDCLPIISHCLFMSCQPYVLTTIHRMPVIYPTPYMLQKYKEGNETDSETYAKVLHSIYCETFGLKKTTVTLADKGTLLEYLYNPSKTKSE